jgi:acyl carrier protein
LLGRLLRHDQVQVGVVRMDWERWRNLEIGSRVSQRYVNLCKEGARDSDGSSADGMAVRKTLLAASPERRKELLLNFLRDKVARVLGASADKVDLAKPLTDLGLDSLMAVELRNWVEKELRVSLPIAELLQGPSVDRMADLLLEQFTKSETTPAPSRPGAEEKAPVADHASTACVAIPHLPRVNGDGHANGDGRANGDGHANGDGNGKAGRIDLVQAEQLLAKVDDLSDAEVDALLDTLESEKEARR